MDMAMYDAMVDWYDLVDPVSEHKDEAERFEAQLRTVLGPGRHALLELGAGAGNNAWYLGTFRRTLTDLSPAMQARSVERNPGVEHVLGDMRTLRLERTFDAVLVHDAICYMQTEDDLRQALITAFVHLRPGGAALFVPDCTTESYEDEIEFFDEDDPSGADRGLCGVGQLHRPDPAGTTYVVDYAWLVRDGTRIRAVHDRHVEGLFPTETWERLLCDVGFEVTRVERPAERPYCDFAFLAVRP